MVSGAARRIGARQAVQVRQGGHDGSGGHDGHGEPTERAEHGRLHQSEVATVLHLVRENLRLLNGLASHFEVGRLLPETPGTQGPAVRCPRDVAEYLQAEMAGLAQEQLRVVLLNARNRIMAVSLVYQGGVDTAAVTGIGDCFREAVRAGAAAVILVHNHPSADPTPSPEDVQLTRRAGEAGLLLGIEVFDHIILGRPDFISLRECGLYVPPAPPSDDSLPIAADATAPVPPETGSRRSRGGLPGGRSSSR